MDGGCHLSLTSDEAPRLPWCLVVSYVLESRVFARILSLPEQRFYKTSTEYAFFLNSLLSSNKRRRIIGPDHLTTVIIIFSSFQISYSKIIRTNNQIPKFILSHLGFCDENTPL